MKRPKAYIIEEFTCGDYYPGEEQAQCCSIATDQVFLKEETAHARARALCKMYAQHNNVKVTKIEDFDRDGETIHSVHYDGGGFYNYSEFHVREMTLCDVGITPEDEIIEMDLVE